MGVFALAIPTQTATNAGCGHEDEEMMFGVCNRRNGRGIGENAECSFARTLRFRVRPANAAQLGSAFQRGGANGSG